MCVSRLISRESKCGRSARPVRVGVNTCCPAACNCSRTRFQYQLPIHAPWTSTKVAMGILLRKIDDDIVAGNIGGAYSRRLCDFQLCVLRDHLFKTMRNETYGKFEIVAGFFGGQDSVVAVLRVL